MSSSDHDDLNLDLFTEAEEGQAMDIELDLGSSEHEGDGELDPKQVDEASHKEGTPNVTDTAEADEKMESSEVEVALKIVTEVGTQNPDLIEIPEKVEEMTTEAVTLTESEKESYKLW